LDLTANYLVDLVSARLVSMRFVKSAQLVSSGRASSEGAGPAVATQWHRSGRAQRHAGEQQWFEHGAALMVDLFWSTK